MRKSYKRDYITLDCKDVSFRSRGRSKPSGYVQLEVKDNKSSVMVFVEGIKYTSEGYRVIMIDDELNTRDIGRVLVSERVGRGELRVSFDNQDLDIKCIAITYNEEIPLIGFKGQKIENYEELLFRKYEEVEDSDEETDYREEIKDDEKLVESINEDIEEVVEESEDLIENVEEENIEELIVEREEVESSEERENPQKKKEDLEEKEKEKKEDAPKISFEEYKEKERVVEEKTYLVPRRLKKILKRYKEVKPVTDDVDNIRWWKIDINPMSMVGYDMPHLGYMYYINYTAYSDIGFLAYKYRHYIFGINYDEDGQRRYYVYGIPGRRHEQPDGGETGFTHFIGCKDKEDDYGYWVCHIDCKSRLIAMPQE
ncbi:AAA family ATPase [Alkalithermobacter paradoxus]|uniref:Uncharacterized protein n=1 Tax=Alkalithermobacter paradoxus TaxID=29349 RepID=A0A1V4I5C7_9FIRM|nr:hypothetical protein CLOTH_17350 [[Clostridium] thermoalcaliphilum]